MEFATWAAVAVLGPGALVIFIWFLIDLRRVVRPRSRRPLKR